MKTILNPDPSTFAGLLKRPLEDLASIEALAREIFAKVQTDGDKAVIAYTQQFDKIGLDSLKVTESEINAAEERVDKDLREAIRIAAENIELFHTSQVLQEQVIGTMPGVYCWQKQVPLETVGVYVPGGTAPLFSTVLMLGIPARVAECPNVVLCTPPGQQGQIDPAILYTAKLVGIKNIYSVGGIQAIAALTHGTESIPRVDKIFGPGNKYVTAAKELASRMGVAIDMPAGPSEVLVVADETANPAFVAADLLSQAEHGTDSQAVLITWSQELAAKVEKEISRQLEELPRKEIARQALQHSALVVVKEAAEAVALMNEYAPEHLILAMDMADSWVDKVKNAGSVFLGHYTPESAGDYASGTNHTLPTYGYAKAWSGLTVDSFVKKITFQKISREGLDLIGPVIETMAEAEQLSGHKLAVSIRRKA